MRWKTADWPVLVRWLTMVFLIVNAAGYVAGFALVQKNTELTVQGVADQYAGNESRIAAGERLNSYKFQVSPREMLSLTHTHLFNMSVSFFLVGLIFSATDWADRLKKILILETMLAILTTFLGLWLTAFVHRQFAWLAYISSAFMGLGYFLIVGLSLVDLWRKRRLPVAP